MAVNYKPYPYTQEASDKFLKADGTWGDNNELISTIEENELVTAAALTNLDSRINSVEGVLQHCESLTWIELKEKRDNHDLIPGRYYRITDYVTITAQENTQSAEHPFDIIVLALSDNTLSETAYAALNEDDEYFGEAGAKLDAWELKYCLDNDADRFAWAAAVDQITPDDVYDAGFRGCYLVKCEYYNGELAVYRNYRKPEQDEGNAVDDEPFVYKGQIDYDGSTYYAWQKVDGNDYVKMILTDTLYSVGQIQKDEPVAVLMVDYDDIAGGGRGVIYYMKDEWNNECPYDFKNIQFKRWAITDITSNTLSGDALNELKNTYVFSSNGGKHFAAKNAYGDWIPSSQGITITVDENSFGWYYTFNGMSSEDGETINETYDVSTHHFKVTQDCIDYIINDYSGLNTQDICFDNKVLEFMQEYIGDDLYSKGRYVLNNIVFINGLSFCYYNEDDGYWEFSTAECYGNVFKSNCNSNTFGNDCYNNSFGNNCWYNAFGNGCNSNSFGNYVGNNTFGNGCNSSSFGNGCNSNSFGNNCWYNTFGNGCNSNSFGNYFQNNTFGNNAYSNTFGNNCWYNAFGNYFQNNTFGNNCWYNAFGNDCYNNSFGNDCYNNSFGNAVNHVTFNKDYTYYVIVENGNQYITLTSTATTSSSNKLRNITIAQGVNNTSTNKPISHNSVNDTIKTTYQPANSEVKSV